VLASRVASFTATVLAIVLVSLWSTGDLARLIGGDAKDACSPPCMPFEIVWTGDILLADRAQPFLERFGYAWAFEHVRPLLDADFVIGNAEGPITTRSEQYFPKQQFEYNAQPAAAAALAAAGFDALGLSNNHALDRGPEGLRDTLAHIRAAGLRTFGAGMDADEAAAPLLIETPHGIVGVVGMGDAWNYGAVAGPAQPGTVPFSDEAMVRLRQAAIAAGARWVVAYVHWGNNYADVQASQRRTAASFARAGYDLVVGSHPHVAQEVAFVDGMPVIYSLGNFAFGSSGRYTRSMPGQSLVARSILGPSGFQSIELTCILTDNDVVTYQPRPCPEDEARQLMRRLGSSVTLRGDMGVVDLRKKGA